MVDIFPHFDRLGRCINPSLALLEKMAELSGRKLGELYVNYMQRAKAVIGNAATMSSCDDSALFHMLRAPDHPNFFDISSYKDISQLNLITGLNTVICKMSSVDLNRLVGGSSQPASCEMFFDRRVFQSFLNNDGRHASAHWFALVSDESITNRRQKRSLKFHKLRYLGHFEGTPPMLNYNPEYGLMKPFPRTVQFSHSVYGKSLSIILKSLNACTRIYEEEEDNPLSLRDLCANNKGFCHSIGLSRPVIINTAVFRKLFKGRFRTSHGENLLFLPLTTLLPPGETHLDYSRACYIALTCDGLKMYHVYKEMELVLRKETFSDIKVLNASERNPARIKDFMAQRSTSPVRRVKRSTLVAQYHRMMEELENPPPPIQQPEIAAAAAAEETLESDYESSSSSGKRQSSSNDSDDIVPFKRRKKSALIAELDTTSEEEEEEDGRKSSESWSKRNEMRRRSKKGPTVGKTVPIPWTPSNSEEEEVEEEEQENQQQVEDPICRLCREADETADRFDVSKGPQRAERTTPCILDLLEMFNLKEKYKAKVLKACQLSLMGMDIESCSVANTADIDRVNNLKLGSHCSLNVGSSASFEVVQRPVLIGNIDFLHDEEGELDRPAAFGAEQVEKLPCHEKVFHIGDDENVNDVVEKYIRYVIDRRNKITSLKIKMFQELFDMLTLLKRRHKEFLVPRIDPKWHKGLSGSWRASIFGKLETALCRLVNNTRINGYNSSGYDYPLIISNVIVACASIGQLEVGDIVRAPGSRDREGFQELSDKPMPKHCRLSPKVAKNGSKIKFFSIPAAYCAFHDITDYIVPGYNLATFAETTGLKEIKKGHFCFDELSSYDYLVRTTQLPSDPEAWTSTLTGKVKTADEIAQANQDFIRYNCKNLLDYILVYLSSDLHLVIKASLIFYTSFYELTNTHTLLGSSTSISSYSYSAMINYMARQKSVAPFVPDNAQLYHILNDSALGGLTMVASTLGGEANPRPINEHLFPENKHTANHVSYYDVRSLYAFAT